VRRSTESAARLARFVLVYLNRQQAVQQRAWLLSAGLGINRNRNRLRTAKKYLYMLAGVVHSMRVLSVEHLLLSASRDKQTDENLLAGEASPPVRLPSGLYS
jgi:hypothetical protein